MKPCNSCKKLKSPDQYSIRLDTCKPRVVCKVCTSKKAKEYYQKNKKRKLKYMKEWYRKKTGKNEIHN